MSYQDERKEIGTQTKVATLLGISHFTLSNRECGRQEVRLEHHLAFAAIRGKLPIGNLSRARYKKMRTRLGSRAVIGKLLGVTETCLAYRENGKVVIKMEMTLALRELNNQEEQKRKKKRAVMKKILAIRQGYAGNRFRQRL